MAAQRIHPLPGATRDPSSEAVRVWLVLGSVCAALFVIDLFTVQSGYGAHIDRSISLTIHGWFGGSGFGVFTAISAVGGSLGSALLVALIALGLVLHRRWRSAALLITAVAGGALVNQVVKDIVARPRPHLFRGALHASGYSFPSGHAMNAMIVFGVCIQLSWIFTHRREVVRSVAFIALVLAALIGLSRIVFGVHYPTDVFGGFMLGIVWVGCVFTATSVLERAIARAGPSI